MKLFRKRNSENTPKLPLMKAATLALLRHLLTFIGGALGDLCLADPELLCHFFHRCVPVPLAVRLNLLVQFLFFFA